MLVAPNGSKPPDGVDATLVLDAAGTLALDTTVATGILYAIIAAGLSVGMNVDQIEKHYLDLGGKVFKRSFWRKGLTQDKYDADAVAAALQRIGLAALPLGLMAVGAGLKLGGLKASPGLAAAQACSSATWGRLRRRPSKSSP